MRQVIYAILFSVVLLNSFNSNSQTYYDAKVIRQRLNANLGTFVLDSTTVPILKKYFPIDTLRCSDLSNNPFLKGMCSGVTFGNDKSSLLPALASAVSPLGGFNVTKFANAIADIMIERTKQELTIAFFDRFKKFANDNPEFQILFPKTTSNLNKLLSFTYPQMLPALRNGFFEDLKQITHHLDDVLELPRYQTLLRKFPEVRVAIRSLTIIQELETKTSNAADAIKDFALFPEWKGMNTNTDYSKQFKNFGNTVKLASIFSESLRETDTSTHRIWVLDTAAKQLSKDPILFKIYLGLIYQQCKNDTITFYVANGLVPFADSVMAKQKDDLLLFQNKVTELLILANKVNDSYIDIRKKTSGEDISNDDYYNYINVSIDVIDYSFSIVKIFNDSLINDNYLTIARKSNNLYRDIYTEKYTQAVTDGIDILRSVYDLVNQNRVTDSVKEDRLKKLLDFAEDVKPYALFMANMVEAKSEDEVKAALENVILPVGSSSIKKHTLGNLSVQTYLGAYLSFSNKSNINSFWSDKFGVIAPIGISWTPGFASLGKGGSFSLFGSLFDLGAIVDYRLKKEPDPISPDPNATVTKKDYEVKLGQIFSPGGYLVYGFPANLPLSFGVGAQYGPGLSKIDSGINLIVNNPSWRWNCFLAVDIPFFNLKNKIKDK